MTSSSKTGSRKRKADSQTPQRCLPPALRPLKIVRQPKSSDSPSISMGPTETDVDKDIQKCFVGEYDIIEILLYFELA